MQTIKFFKKDGHSFARINTGLDYIVDYKGYTVGNLPAKFAFIYNEDEDKEGITDWFNFKGLTYVPKSDNPWA